METDSELQKRLDQAEKARREAEIKAEKTEDRSREMEARLQSAKTTADRCLGEKDNVIQDLRQQLAQQQETTRQQVEELEEYVKSQETCFTTQLAGKDKLIDEINEKIIQQQNNWNEEKAKLENRCAEIQTVSEKRRLDLLVAQAKLMQAEGHTNAVIIDLRKTLATTQFEARMTQDRVQAIIRRHRINTLKLVNESLEKGWQTWSAQAAELQLLRADRENRKVQGKGFLKMSEEAMTTVQEDIARDLYDMAAYFREEVNRIMQEFDKHDVDTSVELDNIEAERVSKTPGLGAPDSADPRPSTEEAHQENDDGEDTEDEEDDVSKAPQEEEPSLFDILQDDADNELELEDDLSSEQ